jgi:hypothetical protein
MEPRDDPFAQYQATTEKWDSQMQKSSWQKSVVSGQGRGNEGVGRETTAILDGPKNHSSLLTADH